MTGAAGAAAHGRRRTTAGEPEKWRFQAEMLRAECDVLLMEREVALRKLDRHRGKMEAALKSAVEMLVSVNTKHVSLYYVALAPS